MFKTVCVLCMQIATVILLQEANIKLQELGGDSGRTICVAKDTISNKNIDSFKSCTNVLGNIIITHETLDGMDPDRLEAFSSMKQINGSLMISDVYHNDFKSLTYFRKLEYINANKNDMCLHIEYTSLISLELRSLKNVSCIALIQNNKKLCYVDEIEKSRIIHFSVNSAIENNSSSEDCQQCYHECSRHGCWGAGPDQCLHCSNYRQQCVLENCQSSESICEDECNSVNGGSLCVSKCPPTRYKEGKECKPCNSQCKTGCTGPNRKDCIYSNIQHQESTNITLPRPPCLSRLYNQEGNCLPCHKECRSNCSALECTECNSVNGGSLCVSKCPPTRYKEGKECKPCHSQCKTGCTGPNRKDCIYSNIQHHESTNITLPRPPCLSGLYNQESNCLPCHEECRSNCSALEADDCTDCKHFKDGNFCVSACPQSKYDHNGECKSCHEQCRSGCTSSGPDSCFECKNLKDGLICIEFCPASTYHENEKCKPCHEQCLSGCSNSGADNCNECKFYKDEFSCVQQCPANKYNNSGVCDHCHNQCESGCFGSGANNCKSCKYYKHASLCVPACPSFTYIEENECKPCSNECFDGCTGPEAVYATGGCNSCEKIIITNDTIMCLPLSKPCPDGYSLKNVTFLKENLTNLCGKSICQKCEFDGTEDRTWKYIIIVICIIIALVVIPGSALFAFYYIGSLKKSSTSLQDNNVMEMSLMESSYNDEIEPNLSVIPIIKVTEILKIKALGSGAFGEVHEGVWKPEGKKIKMHVAIKVLHRGIDANSSKEFLDEAKIMATMDHPNLLHLIAVCVTSDIMLITRLMPLGCLLTYVRTNKNSIIPRLILTWCTQIAKGMAYLEDKRLVHRDLAARNVLLEAVDFVKITDFGLATFTDTDRHDKVDIKLPIKWLALECLEERIFTHKSDVWAFGVTVWEVLTFGKMPYENIPARDIPRLLKLGEKLPQPPICSADVYILMVRCWILKPDSRPGFKEIAEEFYEMSVNPRRYVADFGRNKLRYEYISRTHNSENKTKFNVDITEPISSLTRNSTTSTILTSRSDYDGYLIPTAEDMSVDPVADYQYDTIINPPLHNR